jgi:hypothetical protein
MCERTHHETAKLAVARFDAEVVEIVDQHAERPDRMIAPEKALSRCQKEHATNLPARQAHAAATTSRRH